MESDYTYSISTPSGPLSVSDFKEQKSLENPKQLSVDTKATSPEYYEHEDHTIENNPQKEANSQSTNNSAEYEDHAIENSFEVEAHKQNIRKLSKDLSESIKQLSFIQRLPEESEEDYKSRLSTNKKYVNQVIERVSKDKIKLKSELQKLNNSILLAPVTGSPMPKAKAKTDKSKDQKVRELVGSPSARRPMKDKQDNKVDKDNIKEVKSTNDVKNKKQVKSTVPLPLDDFSAWLLNYKVDWITDLQREQKLLNFHRWVDLNKRPCPSKLRSPVPDDIRNIIYKPSKYSSCNDIKYFETDNVEKEDFHDIECNSENSESGLSMHRISNSKVGLVQTWQNFNQTFPTLAKSNTRKIYEGLLRRGPSTHSNHAPPPKQSFEEPNAHCSDDSMLIHMVEDLLSSITKTDVKSNKTPNNKKNCQSFGPELLTRQNKHNYQRSNEIPQKIQKKCPLTRFQQLSDRYKNYCSSSDLSNSYNSSDSLCFDMLFSSDSD